MGKYMKALVLHQQDFTHHELRGKTKQQLQNNGHGVQTFYVKLLTDCSTTRTSLGSSKHEHRTKLYKLSLSSFKSVIHNPSLNVTSKLSISHTHTPSTPSYSLHYVHRAPTRALVSSPWNPSMGVVEPDSGKREGVATTDDGFGKPWLHTRHRL